MRALAEGAHRNSHRLLLKEAPPRAGVRGGVSNGGGLSPPTLGALPRGERRRQRTCGACNNPSPAARRCQGLNAVFGKIGCDRRSQGCYQNTAHRPCRLPEPAFPADLASARDNRPQRNMAANAAAGRPPRRRSAPFPAARSPWHRRSCQRRGAGQPATRASAAGRRRARRGSRSGQSTTKPSICSAGTSVSVAATLARTLTPAAWTLSGSPDTSGCHQ